MTCCCIECIGDQPEPADWELREGQQMTYMHFYTNGALAAVVAMNLMGESQRRMPFDWALADAAWNDGGYCIDAPGVCLAGSMLNLGCGGEPFPFPSFYERFY